MEPIRDGAATRRLPLLVGVGVGLGLVALNGALWTSGWERTLALTAERDLSGIVDLTRAPETPLTGPVRVAIMGASDITSGGLALGPGAALRIATRTDADQADVALSGTPPLDEWTVILGNGTDHVLKRMDQRADGARRRYPLQPEKQGLWIAVKGSGADKSDGERADRGTLDESAPTFAYEDEGARPRLWEVRYTFAHRQPNALPPAALLLATILATSFLLTLSLKDGEGPGGFPRRWFRWALSGAIVVAGLLLSVSIRAWELTRGQEAALLWIEVATLVAAGFVSRDGRFTRDDGNDLALGSFRVLAILAAIFVVGCQLRWGGYTDHRRELLPPDARGFLEIVQSGAWYRTAASEGPWVREPMWIWVNRVAGWIVGVNENTLRLMSLLAGLLVIVQTARLGTRWFGPGVGLLAAAGLALSPRWIQWTALGLRTDWYTLAIVTFVLRWDRSGDRGGGSGRDTVGLGLLAAVANLTYVSSLAWTLPLLAWRFWRGRWPARRIGLCLVLAIVPLLPHLAFNYTFHNSHDFFFSSNVHARFYRNYERHGLPGSPDRERFLRDPYEGPPVSTLEYLFGEHSFKQLVTGAVRGAWNIYVYRVAGVEQFGASKILTLVYAIGVAAALFSRNGRKSLGLFVWLGLPFLFLAVLPGFATRLLAPLTPWMWMYLALGVSVVVGFGHALLPRGATRRRAKPEESRES